MKVATFLHNFNYLAEAPNGIPKLRELVLLLGIRGKLVERVDDEPLNFANSEGYIAEHCKEVGIRVQKRVIEVDEQDEPWKLPQHWSWQRLGNISIYNGRQNLSPDQLNENMWSLELEDIEKSSSRLLAKRIVRERQPKSTRTTFVKGDLLYGKLRPYLDKVLVADDDGFATTEIAPIVALDGVSPDYLRWVLKSRYFIEHVNSLTYGINLPRLNTTDARNVAIPVPPTAEQLSIVAKVDELMALCDELEQRQQKWASVRLKLNKASLHSLTTATDNKAFQRAWTRIVHNFDILYTTPKSIKDLRQSILQLAVQGKLVRQDPNDEPAMVSLCEIKAEIDLLVNHKKHRKLKFSPEIEVEEVPFEIPEEWEWVRLNELVAVGTGSTPTRTNPEYFGGSIPWYTSSATNHIVAEEPSEYITEKAINETNCKVFPSGSLIIALYGQGKTRGQISEIKLPGATNQAIAAMVFYKSSTDMKEYLKYYFLYIYRDIRKQAAGGAQPNLNVGKIKNTLIPVPPLAEQKRIVKKVDRLMALCDVLEAMLTKSQSQADKLMDAIVHNLTNR